MGFESLDYRNQAINQQVLDNELQKMNAGQKKAFAEKLLAEAQSKGKAAE